MFDFLTEKFSSVFSRLTGRSHLTESNIQESLQKVTDALLEADVPYDVVTAFITQLKDEVVGQKVLKKVNPGEQFIKLVHERLVAFLGGGAQDVAFSFALPSVIMVMGLQGSGKTTSIAKMAHWVNKQAAKKGKQRRILCASVDYARPAAIEQLEILAGQVNVDFYRATSTEPIAAARDIYTYFKNNRYDLLFLDTAGRLHVDNQLLEQLQSIKQIVSPRYQLLVLDAMTGQESLAVARAFDQAVGFDRALLSKMDSDTRAGAAFAFRYVLKKPIVFVGMGEKVDELEQFYPGRMAQRILGMGDVVSLVERAQEKISKSEQESLEKRMRSGKFTLNDFAAQMGMVSKMGSLSQIVRFMPGMGGMRVSQTDLERGEREMKKFKAIIGSMTPKERAYPRLLDLSRKDRIARGAGVQAEDIGILLKRFEESQQFVKLFKRMGRF